MSAYESVDAFARDVTGLARRHFGHLAVLDLDRARRYTRADLLAANESDDPTLQALARVAALLATMK